MCAVVLVVKLSDWIIFPAIRDPRNTVVPFILATLAIHSPSNNSDCTEEQEWAQTEKREHRNSLGHPVYNMYMLLMNTSDGGQTPVGLVSGNLQ